MVLRATMARALYRAFPGPHPPPLASEKASERPTSARVFSKDKNKKAANRNWNTGIAAHIRLAEERGRVLISGATLAMARSVSRRSAISASSHDRQLLPSNSCHSLADSTTHRRCNAEFPAGVPCRRVLTVERAVHDSVTKGRSVSVIQRYSLIDIS